MAKTFTSDTYCFSDSDRLLAYTDGLPEARNERGEFPFHSYREVLATSPPEDALDRLLAAVDDHVGTGARDDLAVILVSVLRRDDASCGQETAPNP